MNKDEILKSLEKLGSPTVNFTNLEGTEYKDSEFGIHPKEFPMFKMNNIPVPEDDGSVSYKYNTLGFRSDEFEPKTLEDKSRLVFAGCSEGEGVGGNIDESWTGMTYQEAKDLLNLDGFYNLSVDNFGFQKIILNCLLYAKKFGNPDYFVVLFPDVSRVFKWLDDEKQYTTAWEDPNHLEIKQNRELFMDSFINFIIHMNMFEEFCRTNSIKLFWSTWSRIENSAISELQMFDNFIEFDFDSHTEHYSDQGIVKRDGHQGVNAHRLWSINITNAIIEYEKNNAKT